VGIVLPDSQKAEARAVILEVQFQPVKVLSVPTVIWMVEVLLRSYLLTPATELNLSNPESVQEFIRDLKFGKAPEANSIPNRALNHLPERALSLQD
jgi:hypothetical protein